MLRYFSFVTSAKNSESNTLWTQNQKSCTPVYLKQNTYVHLSAKNEEIVAKNKGNANHLIVSIIEKLNRKNHELVSRFQLTV